MTLSTGENDISSAQVHDYLVRHPGFFNEHPALLRQLEIPHDNGTAVSLWERQISALREEHEALKSRYQEMLDSARENATVMQHLQRLALRLLEAAGAGAVVELLTRGLADELKADRITMAVFAEANYQEGDLTAQFRGRNAPERDPFADMLADKKILCGRLTLLQTQALFGGEDFRGSHVVLPLNARDWDGLLAISSTDPARFEAGLGTEYLAFLRDIVVLVLAPWVKAGGHAG